MYECKYLLNVCIYKFINKFGIHTTFKTYYYFIKFIFTTEKTFPKRK